MLVYFNKNGQLLERLEYGSIARVGSTNFRIFAYFEDIELAEYGAALIRFQRPDLSSSEYPDLFMTVAQITFDNSIEHSKWFVDGESYTGYVFDFSTVINGYDEGGNPIIVRLLDTPGMWEATISLINSITGATVEGIIKFNVGGAVSAYDEEETVLDYDTISNVMAQTVASKPNKIDTFIVVNNIASIDLTTFLIGQLLFDRTSKKYYIRISSSPYYALYEVEGGGGNDKVDKVDIENQVYATALQANEVVQTSLTYAQHALGLSIVQRQSNAQITVPQTPSANTDAASKKYVDDSVSNVLTEQQALDILEGNEE